MILTVRAWFRLLRRSAWEHDPPEVILFLRNGDLSLFQAGPLSAGIRLASLKDCQSFIDGDPPPRPGRPWRYISGITE